jgi:uncharacterized protein YndB with AHSA1/START domain
MPDIIHYFPIRASIEKVFQAVSTPSGLDKWWTESAAGESRVGAEYKLRFGPEYDWRARVTRYVPYSEFELQLTESDQDWRQTRLGFSLREKDGATQVRFLHLGWPQANDHYHTSCFCWAMYLRLLRRYLEHGEFVPYEDRLDV